MRWLNVFLLLNVSLLVSAEYASSKHSAEVAQGTDTSADSTTLRSQAHNADDEERAGNAIYTSGGWIGQLRRRFNFAVNRKYRDLMLHKSDSALDVFKKMKLHEHPFTKGRITSQLESNGKESVAEHTLVDEDAVRELFKSDDFNFWVKRYQKEDYKMMKVLVGHFGSENIDAVLKALEHPNGKPSRQSKSWLKALDRYRAN